MNEKAREGLEVHVAVKKDVWFPTSLVCDC